MDPFAQSPEFLAAFRDGRPEALAAVYKHYERPLRNFVLRGFAFKSDGRQLYFSGISADHDLDDVIQETFRRAFGVKARQAYDGIRPYKNYLFTIARNAVITDLTARKRQIPVGEAIMRDAPGEDLSPLETWVVTQRMLLGEGCTPCSEERIENLEIYGLLMGFLESLTSTEERFFRLRFLCQCSQEGTARRMGWNRARVRKIEDRLRRAFLAHANGTGYLEMRPDGRRVRRVDDQEKKRIFFARSRAIWRERRAELANEFLSEAA